MASKLPIVKQSQSNTASKGDKSTEKPSVKKPVSAIVKTPSSTFHYIHF